MRVFGLAVGLVLVSAVAARADTLQPWGWDTGIRLAEASDVNPDPHVVEINLEARVADVEIAPGVRTRAWTYNGGLPGPLIRTRVGDRVIVHFHNTLPAASTVHWHGVRVPIEMDGVPGISQAAVKPGESFTYDFVVPDAGLFWYHPHVMSAAQVGFGLYGPLLVEDPTDGVGVADELVMVLSDIGIDERTGELEAPDAGGQAGNMLGREGSHILVNGRVHPKIVARDRAQQRWRIVNTAKSRYFELHLGNAQKFLLIGVDGGLMEYPVETEQIVLGPGERADVVVAPKAERGPLVLQSYPFDRGFGSTEFRTVEDLVAIDFDPTIPPAAPAPWPKVSRRIEPLSGADAKAIRLELSVVDENADRSGFGINGLQFPNARPILAALGETQVWTITNKAAWAHPMHLHGFFFLVLDGNGNPVHPIAWKDTVNVPVNGTVRVVTRFDRRGSWMYHCHILDHAEAGLMSTVDVGMPSAAPGTHRH